MKIGQVVDFMPQGKKFRRSTWVTGMSVSLGSDGMPVLTTGKETKPFCATPEELMAQDWETC